MLSKSTKNSPELFPFGMYMPVSSTSNVKMIRVECPANATLPVMLRDISIIYSRIRNECGILKSILFLAKYAQYLPYSIKWLAFANRTYTSSCNGESSIEDITKFFRPYFDARFGASERLGQITSHYAFLERVFKLYVHASIIEGEQLSLATIYGRSAAQYSFYVGRDSRFRHEGECTLFMQRIGDEKALAALTFTICADGHGAQTLRIGGLQGPSSENAKQDIIDATKDLDGLRPKAAVLQVLRNFAACLKIQKLEAIATEHHPLSNTGRRFVANNDAFWQENEGIEQNGAFVIPVQQTERNLEEVVAKRRKAWLAKQEMKRDVREQVSGALATWFKR